MKQLLILFSHCLLEEDMKSRKAIFILFPKAKGVRKHYYNERE